MNILIIAAGNNQTFSEAGYIYPKNLVEIDGKPLLQRVFENVSSSLASMTSVKNRHFTFLLRSEECKQSHTASAIKLLSPTATIKEAQGMTAGAACTALLAIDEIDNDEPLIITNGDIIFNTDLGGIVDGFVKQELDGGIVVFDSIHPRWSYVSCDETGLVTQTAEKRPISNLATAGFYYFAKGKDFVASAASMIEKGAHVNGVYYICPTYNEMVLKNKKIGMSKIDKRDYITLSTPKDVEEYDIFLKQANRGKHAS